MSQTNIRDEAQYFATAEDLVDATTVAQNGDLAIVGTRQFVFTAGSALVHDGSHVIDQTTETANGRWLADNFANILQGTIAYAAIPAGQTAVIQGTVAAADTAKANIVVVTNAGTLGDSVYITSKEVVAANTVQITIRNAGTVEQGVGNLAVKVLEL